MSQTPASHPTGAEEIAKTEEAVASFFAIAQEDLEASMVLYDRKLYRPSVLLFQQAVEKAVKSLALQMGVIELGDLKKVQHKPQEVYTGLIIKFSDGLTNIMKECEHQRELQPTLPPISKDMDTLLDSFSDRKSQALRTAAKYNKCRLLDDEVTDLLTIMHEMNQGFFDWEQSCQHYLGEKEFNGYVLKGTLAAKIILFFMPMNPKNKSNLNNQIDEIAQQLPPIGRFIESISVIMTSLIASAFPLFYLSLLSAPHAMVARYPNATKENIDPSEFYTEGIPLIANLPEIFDVTKQVFDQMERFYSHLTYLPEIGQAAFPQKEKPSPLPKKSDHTTLGGTSL